MQLSGKKCFMKYQYRSRLSIGRFIPLVLVVAFFIYFNRGSSRRSSGPGAPAQNAAQRAVDLAKLVAPPQGVQRKDGVAAAILIDVSGSMSQKVNDSYNRPRPKIDIA